MTTLVIGSGLIGSQVARILAERGEKPVLMDHAAQPHAIGQIVDLGKVTLIAGDVLRPLSVVDAICSNGITKIVHTAANPLLTLGAQKEPHAAINLNIMGTTNVLEAARVTGLKRVVVSSSSVLNHYLEGGSDHGDFGQEEAFPRSTRRPSRRSRASASTTQNGAGSSSRGYGMALFLDRGVARAAVDRRTSCVTQCAMPLRAKRPLFRRDRWSGSILRTRPAAPSLRSTPKISATGFSI